ncbi:MAG TPA: tetratricopeptide repeat protein [Chitinophagales bacterium]|jgi:tetratricopeptide (TPR) repeat protein|nr:tetratricopeptide repeat protein [Chitinophagales bacterium]HQV77928.1 tetratricopeptide repeat protein [Chitinophagales bacterium]HQW78650.1 tetratricopeptide repeat protein [Chitinophagales bacterium]HRB19044.1 tetratricopeptide repeat protein [Chitinophagales bacterium]HRB67902.1 tetratricopeptide repeat protein [Chitinophagales bacterium]
MDYGKLYVKYRFYGAIVLLIIGILLHIFVHKGWQWSIFLYIISISFILFDILIGPMRYLQKKVEAGDIEGAKEVMSWIRFPNLLIKPVRQGYYMLQSNFDMANQDLASAEANIRKSLANKSDMMGTSQEGVSYLQLGGIALQKGDSKEALKNLKIAVQKGLPDDDNLATAYLQICSIYAQRREIKVAKEYLRRANALKVKSDEIKKHLKDINKQMARA